MRITLQVWSKRNFWNCFMNYCLCTGILIFYVPCDTRIRSKVKLIFSNWYILDWSQVLWVASHLSQSTGLGVGPWILLSTFQNSVLGILGQHCLLGSLWTGTSCFGEICVRRLSPKGHEYYSKSCSREEMSKHYSTGCLKIIDGFKSYNVDFDL